MKILIISEDSYFTNTISNFFKNTDFDLITYRMIIKALDNIEEIKPEVIILSAIEYPRHWKTLVQYAKSGIGSEKVSVFLFNPYELDDDERIKIENLEITGILTALEPQDLAQMKAKIEELYPVTSAPVHKQGKFILSHPVSNVFITGRVNDYCENAITCTFDSEIKNLYIGDEVKYFTFYTDEEKETFSVIISQIDINNKKIVFTIKENYAKA